MLQRKLTHLAFEAGTIHGQWTITGR